jgi:hypothetical protein
MRKCPSPEPSRAGTHSPADAALKARDERTGATRSKRRELLTL